MSMLPKLVRPRECRLGYGGVRGWSGHKSIAEILDIGSSIYPAVNSVRKRIRDRDSLFVALNPFNNIFFKLVDFHKTQFEFECGFHDLRKQTEMFVVLRAFKTSF